MGKEKEAKKEGPAGGKADQAPAKAEKKTGARFGIRFKFTLAIMFLVSVIIMSITVFFLIRESDLLEVRVMKEVERELVHLSNTAQQSVGVDELSIIDAIRDLQKIEYLKYAYILDKENAVVQSFDRRGKSVTDRSLNEKLGRKLDARDMSEEMKVLTVKDPNDALGKIFEFSRIVLNKLDNKKKIATVVIGLSDVIIRNERANLIKSILLISLVFLGISSFASIILAGITIKPIRELTKGVEIIGKGNLDYRIVIKSRDELGQLAAEFNQMTAQIKTAKEREIESRIMEEQVEMAKEIQEGLNPMGYYEKNGIQIKGHTKAARGVGGDYFDYIDINDDEVGALISDVSGKGIPASLVMVMIRTVFTSYISRKDVNCASVIRAINDSLSVDIAVDKFATLFFMIYDRRTEELSFSNAGQGPLFCYRSSMKACTLTKLDGVPIGIMDDFEYKQAKVKLNPGDIVILYTDGVTEMRNSAQEEYGLKRVQNLLIKHHDLDAARFVDLLVEDLERFRGDEPPHDDTTLLVLKRIS